MSVRKRTVLQIAVIFLLNIMLALMLAQGVKSRAVSYSWGSSGSTVTKIQTRLKQWGYYDGTVDGIYGSRTYSAVKLFQRKNGLAVDGVAGPATLAAMGLGSVSASSSQSTDSNLYLLARIISAEARGEPYTGQVAVGAVVMNRVKHPSFPNSISGVVYQNGAFSALLDGQFDQPISSTAYSAARDALNGWDPTGGAIYYYNPAKTTNSWIYSRQVITQIGEHVFAK